MKTPKIVRQAKKRLAAGVFMPWQISESIPMTFLNRTQLERPVRYYASDEFYKPTGAADWPSQKNSQLALHLNKQVIPKPYVVEIENALMCNTHICDPAQPESFFPEALSEYSVFAARLGGQIRFREYAKCRYLRQIFRPTAIGPTYLFGSPWSSNYYHFLFDAVLKFHDARAHCPDAFLNRKLVLHRTPTQWQKQYLELLDITPSDILICDPKRLYQSENLLLASSRRHRYCCSKSALSSLKERILDRIPSASNTSRRLFISRSQASKRSISNEAELTKPLKQRGFDILHLENMTVTEQIQSFANAEVILGVHGAGLSNMLYSNRAKVIEIHPNDEWHQGHYLCLAATLNAQYEPFITKTDCPNSHMLISVSDFLKFLDEKLA